MTKLVPLACLIALAAVPAVASCPGHSAPVPASQIRRVYANITRLARATPEQQRAAFERSPGPFRTFAAYQNFLRSYATHSLPWYLREEQVYARWYATCGRGDGDDDDGNSSVGGPAFSGCNATNPKFPNCDERDCNATNPAFPNC